jgi:hypothetical protein
MRVDRARRSIKLMRQINLAAGFVWVLVTSVALLTGRIALLPCLAMLPAWAAISAHWSAWQAACGPRRRNSQVAPAGRNKLGPDLDGALRQLRRDLEDWAESTE